MISAATLSRATRTPATNHIHLVTMGTELENLSGWTVSTEIEPFSLLLLQVSQLIWFKIFLNYKTSCCIFHGEVTMMCTDVYIWPSMMSSLNFKTFYFCLNITSGGSEGARGTPHRVQILSISYSFWGKFGKVLFWHPLRLNPFVYWISLSLNSLHFSLCLSAVS